MVTFLRFMTCPAAARGIGHAEDMDTIVTNRPEAGRFELTVDGEPAGRLDYQLTGTVALMPHTEVFPAFGGRGLGALLVRAALDHAREANWSVVPACSFVAGYIAAHPEYQDLVAPARH